MSFMVLKGTMSKVRKIHFVIHNQGSYVPTKKDDLLALLKNKYGDNLEGYLIAQEIYTHDPNDTHLQGNLFFKNAIHFTALLKLFKSKYIEKQSDKGLLCRTDLSQVLHEGRAYNYMMNPEKEGGDRNSICDNTALDKRRANQAFTQELRIMLHASVNDIHRRNYDRQVWPSDGPDPSPYQPLTHSVSDFLRN